MEVGWNTRSKEEIEVRGTTGREDGSGAEVKIYEEGGYRGVFLLDIALCIK